MKASKQFSIVLAAAVLAFGAVTVAPQQADASYGYKYTDSQRPPVSTPTGYVNPAMGSTVTVTDPAPTTNTEVTHKNELNTFLPPSQNDVKKKEDPKATEKPLIKIKKSLAKDTVTTDDQAQSTDKSEYQRANGLDR